LPNTFHSDRKRFGSTLYAIVDKLTNFRFGTLALLWVRQAKLAWSSRWKSGPGKG